MNTRRDELQYASVNNASRAALFTGGVALMLLFGLAGCLPQSGDGDGGGCGSDQDCKGDRICEDGACVDPDENGGDGDAGTTNGGDDGTTTGGDDSGTTTEYYCCLNGQYYDCPDRDTVESCFNNAEPGDCTRDSNNDGACDQDNNDDNNDSDVGMACDFDSDCEYEACIGKFEGGNGYCSKPCDSLSDCPSGWFCSEPDDFSSDHCVQEL